MPHSFAHIFCARRGQSVKVATTVPWVPMSANRLSIDSLQQIVESADRAYAGRAETQNVRESVELLRNPPGNADEYEIAWRLSRALFFLGQEPEAETTDVSGGVAPLGWQPARNLHNEGVEAGRRARQLRPARVEGQFWAGVNLALLAALEPRRRAAIHVLQAKRALQRATAIDAAYHGAGPLRVLARLQHKLPRWLGGGVAPARANFERAIAIAPANTVNRIYFAELLSEAGETTRARSELEHVLNASFDPEWAFEIERDRQLAKEMLGSYPSLER